VKLKSFTASGLLYATVLGTALVALGIGFSMTSPSGEQSKISYEGNLWCVSNYIEARDSEGKPVYLSDGRPRKDERLDNKVDWIRKDQVEADSKEEAEKKITKEYFKPSNAEELRSALDQNDKDFFVSHFNTGATTAGPCIGSGFGNGVAGKWVNDGLNEECFGISSDAGCGFDTSKLTLYENKSSGSDPGAKYAQSTEAKQYAISTLGINSADIKQYDKSAVEDMIRAEIARQWPAVANKHGATQEQAQQAILSYQEHEDSRFQLIDSDGKPSYTFSKKSDSAVTNILSLSNDKFHSKNQRIAGSYDIKYAIYMGVKEHMSAFQNSKVSGEGEQRWKNTISHVFTPADPERYWTDSRSNVAKSAWNNYSGEVAYVCQTASVSPQNPEKTSAPNTPKTTIVVDPGHGSAANSRKYEDKTMMEIGNTLASELKSNGYNPVLTHKTTGVAIGGVRSGENQDNIARANIANSSQPAVTIRLHSDDRNDDSFWVIYPDKQGKDRTGQLGPLSNIVIPKSKEFANILSSTLKSEGYSGIVKGETQYSASGKDSLLILSAHSRYPVVTLEVYGHNNPTLRQKYSSASEQTKLAKTIVKAIIKFAPISKASTSAPSTATSKNASASKTDIPPYCPGEPLKSGPSTGEDYQAQIASMSGTISSTSNYNSSNENSTDDSYLPSGEGKASDIVRVATSQKGYKGNGDCTKYDQCNQWCAYFATWVLKQAGCNIPSIANSKATLSWFKSNGHYVFKDLSAAQPGDIIVWDRGGAKGHIGIIVENNQSSQIIKTIEGNVGNDVVDIRQYSYQKARNNLHGLGRW